MAVSALAIGAVAATPLWIFALCGMMIGAKALMAIVLPLLCAFGALMFVGLVIYSRLKDLGQMLNEAQTTEWSQLPLMAQGTFYMLPVDLRKYVKLIFNFLPLYRVTQERKKTINELKKREKYIGKLEKSYNTAMPKLLDRALNVFSASEHDFSLSTKNRRIGISYAIEFLDLLCKAGVKIEDEPDGSLLNNLKIKIENLLSHREATYERYQTQELKQSLFPMIKALKTNAVKSKGKQDYNKLLLDSLPTVLNHKIAQDNQINYSFTITPILNDIAQHLNARFIYRQSAVGGKFEIYHKGEIDQMEPLINKILSRYNQIDVTSYEIHVLRAALDFFTTVKTYGHQVIHNENEGYKIKYKPGQEPDYMLDLMISQVNKFYMKSAGISGDRVISSIKEFSREIGNLSQESRVITTHEAHHEVNHLSENIQIHTLKVDLEDIAKQADLTVELRQEGESDDLKLVLHGPQEALNSYAAIHLRNIFTNGLNLQNCTIVQSGVETVKEALELEKSGLDLSIDSQSGAIINMRHAGKAVSVQQIKALNLLNQSLELLRRSHKANMGEMKNQVDKNTSKVRDLLSQSQESQIVHCGFENAQSFSSLVQRLDSPEYQREYIIDDLDHLAGELGIQIVIKTEDGVQTTINAPIEFKANAGTRNTMTPPPSVSRPLSLDEMRKLQAKLDSLSGREGMDLYDELNAVVLYMRCLAHPNIPSTFGDFIASTINSPRSNSQVIRDLDSIMRDPDELTMKLYFEMLKDPQLKNILLSLGSKEGLSGLANQAKSFLLGAFGGILGADKSARQDQNNCEALVEILKNEDRKEKFLRLAVVKIINSKGISITRKANESLDYPETLPNLFSDLLKNENFLTSEQLQIIIKHIAPCDSIHQEVISAIYRDLGSNKDMRMPQNISKLLSENNVLVGHEGAQYKVISYGGLKKLEPLLDRMLRESLSANTNDQKVTIYSYIIRILQEIDQEALTVDNDLVIITQAQGDERVVDKLNEAINIMGKEGRDLNKVAGELKTMYVQLESAYDEAGDKTFNDDIVEDGGSVDTPSTSIQGVHTKPLVEAPKKMESPGG